MVTPCQLIASTCEPKPRLPACGELANLVILPSMSMANLGGVSTPATLRSFLGVDVLSGTGILLADGPEVDLPAGTRTGDAGWWTTGTTLGIWRTGERLTGRKDRCGITFEAVARTDTAEDTGSASGGGDESTPAAGDDLSMRGAGDGLGFLWSLFGTRRVRKRGLGLIGDSSMGMSAGDDSRLGGGLLSPVLERGELSAGTGLRRLVGLSFCEATLVVEEDRDRLKLVCLRRASTGVGTASAARDDDESRWPKELGVVWVL